MWDGSRDWGEGKIGSYCLMDVVSVLQNEDILEMGCITQEST